MHGASGGPSMIEPHASCSPWPACSPAGPAPRRIAQKALRPYTLILDFVPTGEYVPHYTALEKGWYRDEGLDVKIVRGQARPTRSSASRPARARWASPTSRR